MEIKNSLSLEIVKEDNVYRMEMPAGAPLGEAYMVAGEFMDKFVELINEHAAKRKENEQSQDVQEKEENKE